MSSNIPIIFTPISYNNYLYVDGALLDPYPFDYIKNTNKLGLYIVDEDEYNFFSDKNVVFTYERNNIFNYFMNVLKVLYTNYLKKNYKIKKKNTIYFNLSIESFTFEMDKNKKNITISKGEKIVKNFFNKIYKKSRIKYLQTKYYFIWKKKIFR